MGQSPKQILFEETIDVFDAEAQSIAGGDLVQGDLLIQGDKPTEAGIAFGPFGALTADSNDLDRQITILFEVQVPEAADANGTAFAVLLGANGLRLPMGLLVFSLEESPVGWRVGPFLWRRTPPGR